MRGGSETAAPITPAQLARYLAVPSESLRAAGEEFYGRQAFDSAQLVFRTEVARARTAGDGVAEARARMWSGLAAWRLGDYSAARSDGEAAVQLKRTHGLDAELSRSYNALGLLAWNEGRLRDAEVWFDSAIQAARRHDDRAGVARASANVPLVLTQLGDYDGARRGFESAIAAGQVLNDARLEGNGLTNLAMLETRLGNPTAALGRLAAARERYASIGYETGEANALGQAASAWAALGDLQRAITSAGDALALARRQGLSQEVASNLEVLADLHHQAGDLRRALSILMEADSLDLELGLEVERGANLRRQGTVLLELGETTAGIARVRAALDVHLEAGDRPEEVLDRLLLAELLSRSRDGPGATRELDAARSVSRALGPRERRLVELTAARLALDARDQRGALRALDRLPRSGERVDWQALDLRAAALLARGDLKGARAAAEAAVAEVERERGSLDLGPLRAGYLGGRTAPLSRLIEIHLRQADTAGAFAVAGSIAGRGLAEHLMQGPAQMPAALAEVTAGEALLRRLAALEAELAGVGTDEDHGEAREALDREIAAVRREYDRRASQRGAIPNAGLLGLARPTFPSVSTALPPRTAMLVTVVGPERTDLFVVRRGDLSHRAVRIGGRELAERVRVVRTALQGPAQPHPPEPLRELSRQLLDPWGPDWLADVDRLLVVPHGPLGGLPFVALRLSADGQYLVERVAVVTLPSAGALEWTAAAGPTSGELSLFAPLADSLPGTEREVRAIGRLTRADVSVGRAADEPSVRAALERGGVVHIASHGTLDAGNPLFSMMRLQRARAAGPDDTARDGRLEAHEIMRLTVRSPLVFLSGCETGLAADAVAMAGGSDEGSLAQALLYAGAPAVVATLWRVGDSEAADLALRFYRHLPGRDPAQALAAAQRELLDESRSFGWAGFAVFGTAGARNAAPLRSPDTDP